MLITLKTYQNHNHNEYNAQLQNIHIQKPKYIKIQSLIISRQKY